ncbi:hypothetical protein VTN96DRAFT_5467 [Rasamsonia emersonii]
MSFYIIGTASIFLRIYSRWFIVRSFKWDDWFMTSILFFSAGQQAILYIFLRYGAGLSITAISTENLLMIFRVIFAESIYYVFMHWIIKTTILLFYLRIVHNAAFKYAT